MRRFAELIAVAATAVILIATSQARPTCAVETVNLRAVTTCGPVANLAVSSGTNCQVTAGGGEFGGLPTEGNVSGGGGADAGVLTGFQLYGPTPDGGNIRTCTATPSDAGFELLCVPRCGFADAGPCEESCSGTLTRQ